MYSLYLIHPYIRDLHILIEGTSKLQVCFRKDDFPIWWYDVFIFPNISYDADFFLLLMFGEMQHEQWDPDTLFLNIFCWMVFRSMGVPYKQWDPGIVCPWRSCLHVGMMEQANPILHQFIYVALGFSFPHRKHLIGWTYSLHSSGIFSFMMFLWDLGTLSSHFTRI